jgi:hypothetical protein
MSGHLPVQWCFLLSCLLAILAGEGAAMGALHPADVLALGPIAAIELVLHPKRLVATLRR